MEIKDKEAIQDFFYDLTVWLQIPALQKIKSYETLNFYR